MFNWVKINDGHDNFFTPLRLVFAYMVVIGHTFFVAGGHHPQAEPNLFYDYKPGYIAVNLFFIASGFLVTKSMLYRGDVAEYSSARLLRIYPALIIHVFFVMFIIGPLATNLPLFDYFTDPDFYTQPLRVLTFYDTNMILPGAFTTLNEQFGSAALWTLRGELLAYIGTVILFSLGFMRKKWMLLAQFFLCAAAWTIAKTTGFYDNIPGTFQALLRFGVCYGLGAAIFAYREQLKFHIIGVFLVGIAAALTNGTAIFEVTTSIFLGYFLFWAAYIKLPKLEPLQKLSDVSYGIYIYHWCVLQLTYYYIPDAGPWIILSIVTIITFTVAHASWHLVEKPMLKRKKSFSEYLRFGRDKRSYNAKTMLLD